MVAGRQHAPLSLLLIKILFFAIVRRRAAVVSSNRFPLCVLGFTAPSYPRQSVRRASTVLSSSPKNTFRDPSEDDKNGQSRLSPPTEEGLADSISSSSDTDKWEQMWAEGEARDAIRKGLDDGMVVSSSPTQTSEVRVVTFDLDNTLWKTGATIGAANDALATFMGNLRRTTDGEPIQQPVRVEVLMGELFKENPSRYCPLEADNPPNAAVLLTNLRTDAIKVLLEKYNDFPPEEAEKVAQEAFSAWTQARHAAIPEHYASSVLSCLERISKVTTSTGHPVLIGAITDGNSDPRKVKELEQYFEFCVNAESVGIAKPDKRVYHEAIRNVAKHPAFDGMNTVFSQSQSETVDKLETLENLVGPYWVHIGDDFVKDIVAAKSLNMRSIWATELIQHKLQASGEDGVSPSLSDKDVEKFVKEISEMKVISMSIGSDSYLADTLQGEFVDAVAERFEDIADIIERWHDAANEQAKVEKAPNMIQNEDTTNEYLSLSTQPDDKNKSGQKATEVQPAKPRAFRIFREDCKMDIPAPLKNREQAVMLDVMTMAQLDKSSGVFSFSADDVEAIRNGKAVLMIKVVDADLEFTKDIFSQMSVSEVLDIAEENPLRLSLSIREKQHTDGFDLF